MEVRGRELRGQEDLMWNTDSIETMELKNMTSQAAQDLEDDEHTTILEKLTLTIASGHANTSSRRNVSKAIWTYLTIRGGVPDGSVIHRRPHDHDHDHLHDTTTRVGALVFITLDGSSPQWATGKDTHGTLGPFRREAVCGPTTRPKGEASDNDAPQEHHEREVFRREQTV